ncbi:uncharacterized protein [Chelonus insularis]|uniref:uncharacterized protein n=1 Tax=Chelonus insularis TaxID=460826 RepID=UPI00158C0B3E|nr:uncharacterized protein LOC118066853 [Chelonus insularis]
MGIVSSTLLSVAIQLAWNCQRFLDPRYRDVEPKKSTEILPSSGQIRGSRVDEAVGNQVAIARPEMVSTHQENRNRRAAQLRYRRKRPSSFDASLIVKSMNKNGVILSTGRRVVSSNPCTLKRQPAPEWNDSSSCLSSSSSSMSSHDDSDVEITTKRKTKTLERTQTLPEKSPDKDDDDISGEEYGMSAAEEAAFRMTVGRGYFSKSKKDEFLNHLRLEKRLNDLNREFFDLACRAHARSIHRHHSGDLQRKIL